MKIAQPYRSPGEFQAYLKGVIEAAKAFGYDVDAESWGGGIPNDLTLVAGAGVPKQFDDVYDQEAENAEIPDAATEPNSEGSSPDGEPGSPA